MKILIGQHKLDNGNLTFRNLTCIKIDADSVDQFISDLGNYEFVPLIIGIFDNLEQLPTYTVLEFTKRFDTKRVV